MVEAMPTSESFAFPDEERMGSEVYPFDFSFDNPGSDNPLIKDTGLMELEAGDGSGPTIFNGSTYAFDNVQQSTQDHLALHRGSTSSSSSLRSASSNSPNTSLDVTPMDVSPGEWLEDVGGSEDAFNMDPAIDISQFLTLPGDSESPDPLVPNEPLPDLHMSNESLAQGRAIKRRKAQPKARTKQSLNRSANKAGAKGTRESSPISAQIPSSESSPTALYTNSLPSPDGHLNNFSDVFGSMGMPTHWVATTNNHIKYPLLNPNSAYVSPTSQDLSTGNPPGLLPQSSAPRLVIHPMPVKSRVETQIPLKITLHNAPKGIKKVHLPTHTISKPKLLQKPSTGPSPDTLELKTMLVCTSAMNDPANMQRALGRAAGNSSLDESNSPIDGLEDEDNKTQRGGEVRICMGCITRERKRAGRKKHKKPEEEELWDRYERERAIVFNTQEVKEWQTVTPLMADPTGAGFINGALPEGTVQVDAPMRIACYCRHHGEKLGFRVIITLKDYTGNVVAQGMSSSIMITDDHKTPTQTGPTPTPQPLPPSQHQHSPQPHSQPVVTTGPEISAQAGVVQPVTAHVAPIQPRGVQPLTSGGPNSGDISSLPFRQTHSTSDLQAQGQNPPLAISPTPHPSNPQAVPTATTPRNHSRQASPASPLSVGSRKRKASMVGKVPPGLAMTKIETSQSLQLMSSGAQNDSTVISSVNSPFSAGVAHLPLNGDLSNQGQHMLNHIPKSLGGGPGTPNGSRTEPFVFAGMNSRAMNLERPVNQLFSAPVSAHPSRAPSPSQLRPDAQNLHLSQRSQQEINTSSAMPPPAILRIIPNEGSKCGGAEITVLGSNFTNDGLEVYFGSQKAITTTYWGPTSLVCMLPPSPVSGPVPVTVRHPGRRQVVQQPAIFTYKDDDEDQLIRTALGVLAGQYGRMAADPADFARSILYAQTSASGSNQAPHGSGNNNFTRFPLDSREAVESSLLRILDVMDLDENPSKAEINLRRSSGQTMLHLACSLGFVRFVTGLLSRGANVDIIDKGGFTPLHMAAMNDHPEIVRRLIAKGANRNAQSRSGLKPIDLARSQPVRRNLQSAENHFRSRSVDSRRSRDSSPNPAQPRWESSPIMPIRRREFLAAKFGETTAVNGEDSPEEGIAEGDEGSASPTATMAAIREQVATQLQQFQHTMTMHLQNLSQLQMPNIRQMPNLPPMPVLPGYQAYLQSAPVMQRISSLVPNIRGQRQDPAGDHTSTPGDNKWGVFPFFGTKDFPPAYEDIFPQKDIDSKQSSAAQAAAEFEADEKCAALFDQDSTTVSETQEVPALLQIGRKHLITKEQQETLQRAHAERLKAGSSDKKLWFVWIPILVLVLGAMLWSGAPSLVSGAAGAVKALPSLIANPREIGGRARRLVQELA